jgi:hypothetical protein
MKMKKNILHCYPVSFSFAQLPGDSQSSNQPGGQLNVVLNTEIVGTTTLCPMVTDQE